MKQTTHTYRQEAEIRSIIKNNGERVYLLNDIASCVGYKAPRKFAERARFDKEKVEVRWKSGIRNGRSQMWAVNYENYIRIAIAYQFPKELTEFITNIEDSTAKPEVKHEEVLPNPEPEHNKPVCANDVCRIIDSMMMSLLQLKGTLNL